MTAGSPLHIVDPQKTREFRQVAEGWYRLTLREGLQFDVKRLRWERGELFGLLTVACDLAGAKTVDGMLSVGTFNLTSVSSRSSRAKELAGPAAAPDVDFRAHLEELCQRTITAEQTGQPVILLRNVTPVPDDTTTLTVYGLPLYLRHGTAIFGDGGTGKTTLALAVAGELERRGISTLYLDWELNQYDHHRLLSQLFPDDLPDLKYRRCERSLSLEVDSIAQQIDECGIQYMILDSAGYASDGRPEDAEVALRYFRALRQLRVGSLTVAHISRGEHGTDRPFGSVFWHNSARATWYLERATNVSTDDDTITVGVFNKKNNLGKLRSAFGLAVDFHGGRIVITPTDLADNDQLATKLPLTQRMRSALRGGPRTLAALADELDGANVDTLDRYVRRYTSLFTRVSGDDGVTRIALVERRVS